MKYQLNAHILGAFLVGLAGIIFLYVYTASYHKFPINSFIHQSSISRLPDHAPNVQLEPDNMIPTADMAFVENKGQIADSLDVWYYLPGEAVSVYVRSNGLSYVFAKEVQAPAEARGPESEEGEDQLPLYTSSKLEMSLEGARPFSHIQALEATQDLLNFYTEDHPEGLTNVKRYRKLVFEHVYPFIDFVLYIQDQRVKYDFIIHPGGKVSDIKLKYDGEREIIEGDNGSLTIKTSLGSLNEGKPFTYQEENEQRVEIQSGYQLNEGVISFDLAEYDPSKVLVIDPSLKWASYYGGPWSEYGQDVYTDKHGNVYITGISYGDGIGWTSGLHAEHFKGERDAFLIKFNASGDRLWATFYGGPEKDGGLSVCTDLYNNVYMAGYTDSHEGIAYFGHDHTLNESNPPNGTRFKRDAFLVKFNSLGQRSWGTYYGGEDYQQGITLEKREIGRAVCTDKDGNVFLAGSTTSEEYIAFNGHDNTFGGSVDAFLVKFSLNGTRLWATYFGKSEKDVGTSVATDYWGNVYMAGYTESTGLGYEGHDMSYSEDQDAFLVSFNANGVRGWSTYYGDTGIDQGHSVVVDGFFVYMAGVTSSSNFIAHNGHDHSYNGGMDAFLVKFNVFGIRFWGTYYGGSEDEFYSSSNDLQNTTQVAVSKNGDVYLAGATKSNNGIATANTYDGSHNGGWDAYLARFFPDGSLQWGTYYGGASNDLGFGVTTDVAADVYIVGSTTSPTDIAKDGYDETFNDDESAGNTDIFIAKFKPYGRGNPDGPGDIKDPSRITSAPDPFSPDRVPGLKDMLIMNDESLGLSVYPNPATHQVTLSFAGQMDGEAVVKLFNQFGSVVYQRSYSSDGLSDLSIDLEGMPAGVYVVSVESMGYSVSEKLVIQ